LVAVDDAPLVGVFDGLGKPRAAGGVSPEFPRPPAGCPHDGSPGQFSTHFQILGRHVSAARQLGMMQNIQLSGVRQAFPGRRRREEPYCDKLQGSTGVLAAACLHTEIRRNTGNLGGEGV